MEQYYYVDSNGRQQGPVDKTLLPSYGVTRDTRVWREGMSDWQPAGSVADLADVFPGAGGAATPPPSYTRQATPPPSGGFGPLPLSQKPDNYLVWAILSTVLCCLPAGIASIVYSVKVNNEWDRGNYTAAEQASKNAKTWAIVSVVLSVIGGAILMMTGVLGALMDGTY